MRKLNWLHVLIALLMFAVGACSSGKPRKDNEKSLVSVAIVKLVNVSKQANYDYLSESLTDATQSSMDKKFVYFRIPADQVTDLYAEAAEQGGNPSESSMRSLALKIDADLVIFGYYKTSAEKKGDSAEIVFNVLRTDKGTTIAKISRTAAISAKIFNDIESIATTVVAKIADYRAEQIKESGIQEVQKKGEKIQFTRESLNIAPFIPPAF